MTSESRHSNRQIPNGSVRRIVWQPVTAVIGGIAICVAIGLFLLSREVTALQVVSLATTSLVEVDPTIAQHIKVFYKEQPAANLSLFQLRLDNTGNRAIRTEDYEKPIRIAFPSQSTVVEASVVESRPRGIEITAQIDRNSVTLSPALLNPGDRVLLRFLVVDVPADVNGSPFTIEEARIVGVKDIPILDGMDLFPSTNSTLLDWGSTAWPTADSGTYGWGVGD